MKRNLFGILMIFGVLYSPIKAQDSISHWSLGIKAGIDYYRVTPVSANSGFRNYIDDADWTFPGIFFEYTINPLIGFGGDLSYLSYNRNTAKGHTTDLTLFGSVNMTNLLVPNRTGFWHKVDVYTDLGAGIGSYWSSVVATGAENSMISPLTTTSINADYRLNNSWALRAELQHRYYFREDLGGENIIPNGTGSMTLGVDAFVTSIGLRYKFNAKDKTHVRNMDMSQFLTNTNNKDGQKNALDDIQKRLKAMEDENTASKDKIAKLEGNLDALTAENDSNKLSMQKLQDSLKGIPETTVTSELNKIIVLMDVNFNFGSAQLTDKTKTILNEVALILKANPGWLNLNVEGHTDSIGSDAFNQTLSFKRATAVKDYLISKGFTSSMISSTGFGSDNPKASNNTKEGRYLNRRAELVITH